MSSKAQTSRNDPRNEVMKTPTIGETVLGLISTGAALPTILNSLCVGMEAKYPDMLCSVLLLDDDGVTLRHCASPSLPAAYSLAIDGAQIGPTVGSCGTAAYLKRQIIVSDIAIDPLWIDYRRLALPHGLRACWSTPIASADGKVLGTFAVYYREPRSPEAHHLQMISQATHLAVLAIERDRARRELIAAEARYKSLVERLPAITYVAELGPHGQWHYVSPQIESILGFTPEEWLSQPSQWLDHIHPLDRPIALEAESLFEASRKLFFAEYRMFGKDGRMLWFRDEAVLLEQSADREPLMQGVLYDITDHKNLEEQLRHSQKMEAVGQLAGGIAHDFNNLLMLIQAHNSRLRERIPSGDAEAQQDAQQIEHAVIRAASLTRQLLAFSRKQVLRPTVLDLNIILTDVAKMLERLISKDIEMVISSGDSLGKIKADAVQMEQIILNLAVNARDALPEGGKLTLATQNVEIGNAKDRTRSTIPPGQYVMLSVTDTGVGMASSTQSHIFEPFFTTKEPGKGTGLGLSTVYGVVQQSGGWIWVDSALGLGTRFEIYFPRVDEIPSAAIVAPTPRQAAEPTACTETILLAEDQEGIRDMASEFLRRTGYQVLLAGDGCEALEIATNHAGPIQLLITDMSMPNMGGKELSVKLAALRPQMKVLFMSGHPDHASPGNHAAPEGAVVLQKPFALGDLAQKVRMLLDHA
jgi:PAS domain S-box-containing protein